MVLFAGSLLPYTQYVVMFTAGFMYIPTGRDLLAPGKAILPGDDKLLAAMSGTKETNFFMWRVFGLNFCTLSTLKFMTLLTMGVEAMNFYIIFAIAGTIAVALLVSHKGYFTEAGADITPFLGLFILETAAWYLTILM